MLLLSIPLFSALQTDAHGPTKENTIRFLENKNQWNEAVAYKADVKGGALFLESNAFTYHLIDGRNFVHPTPAIDPEIYRDSIRFRSHAYRVSFLNSLPNPMLIGEGEQDDYYNFFIGNDPSRWASNIKAYTSVLYTNLYAGIDLKVYSQHGYIKYDFIIAAGSRAEAIALNYQGLNNIKIKDGNLILSTSVGTVTEQQPYAYQLIHGEKVQVTCRYKISEGIVSFEFPKGYRPDYTLVIDPVLIFSTYSGSIADNFGYTATPDAKGFLYAGSSIFGIGYPVTLGAFQSTFAGGAPFLQGGTDIGITKYDTSGTKRIYSTYLGGSGDEVPHSLIVNDLDELLILGSTGSTNFPFTRNAFDSTFNGGTPVGMTGIEVVYDVGCDIIITKLNSTGTALVASTYLGGTANDGVLARNPPSNLRYNYADEVRGEIELDSAGDIYIASCTRSVNFPTTAGSFAPTYRGGNFDAVVVKMASNLQTMLWGTFIGGTVDDAAYSIELDTSENLYVCGGTNSPNFPTTSGRLYTAFQGGRADGFIAHLDKNGNSLINSTYYGAPTYDQIYFVGLDRFNNVHVFGQTDATNANATRYIQNAGFSQINSGQFISQITPELDSVMWSTTFGNSSGRPNISPTAFLVDLCSKIYLSGWGGTPENNDFLNGLTRPYNMTTTLGPNPPTDFFQPTSTGHDFYLLVLEGDASALNYASFFGGPTSREHVDGGTSRFDRKGKMYQAMCAGCGANSDMPIRPPFGSTELPSTNNSFNCNIGVFKMDFRLPQVVADFQVPNACVNDSILFTNTGLYKPTTTFQWSFGDGNTSTAISPKHAYDSGGYYSVRLVLADNATCNLADTITKTVYISTINSIATDAFADQYVIYKGKSTTIRATPATGWLYNWSPANTLLTPNLPNSVATPQTTTTYTVTYSDPLVNECRVTDTVTVQVVEIICDEPYIYVPNAFTPNEDGKNELLYVRSRNIRELYFTIYNRWGEKVFETRDQSVGWDGTYKGMKADPGVFVYYLEGLCVDDQKFFKKGNVTLIR